LLWQWKPLHDEAIKTIRGLLFIFLVDVFGFLASVSSCFYAYNPPCSHPPSLPSQPHGRCLMAGGITKALVGLFKFSRSYFF